MNVSMDRRVLSQFAIMAGVCVGAWMLLVQTNLERATKLQQMKAEKETAGPILSRDIIEKASTRMEDIRKRVAEIQASNTLAIDSSRLYGQVMQIAARHGVQVHSLQPGTLQRRNEEDPISLTRIDISVEGPYANVAQFISDVNKLDGLIRPNSVNLTPTQTNDEKLVTVVYSCHVVSVDLPDALLAMGELQHDQP